MRALIAGQGRLPEVLVAADPNMLIAGLEPFLPEALQPDIRFRIETLGSLIEDLRARGVTELCMAGRIARPDIDLARVDDATKPLLARVEAALAKGDDGALRALISIFEDAGVKVVGAKDVADDLLLDAGVATKCGPGTDTEANARRGQAVVQAMGAADVGQACVIAAGQVIGVEALPGTDFLLQSLAPLKLPAGAILFKAAKPGQDLRVDMPTIGVGTVARAAEAGLAGIVVRAGEVIVLDRTSVIEACDAAGLFLWVMP